LPRRDDGKHKRASSPPSEDFGDSEYSEEASSEFDRSPAPASPPTSSKDSDDSMGLSTAARAYWRSIERAGFGGLDESGSLLGRGGLLRGQRFFRGTMCKPCNFFLFPTAPFSFQEGTKVFNGAKGCNFHFSLCSLVQYKGQFPPYVKCKDLRLHHRV
jgi:hypothetical protein